MALVGTSALADALGLSERSVRLYAAQGRIPFVTTPGGHRRFDVAAVRTALGATPARPAPTLAAIRDRSAEIRACARRHGASNVRVAGSVATGTADSESDIDILVTLERGRTYADVDDLRAELAGMLGGDVDVLTDGDCHGRLARLPDSAVSL